MHEKTIEIPTADRRMETFISYPEHGGPFALVVVYMDVWGLRHRPQGSGGRLLCRLT
jgi:dienelactone hydrolase